MPSTSKPYIPKDLKISPALLKWFTIVVSLCAVIGPPLSFVMATQTSKATVELRVKSLENSQVQNDAKWESLNAHLTEIEKVLYLIKGSLTGP